MAKIILRRFTQPQVLQTNEFWAWTKRPDVQTKLSPKREQDQIRQQVVQMPDEKVLGIRPPVDQTGDPVQDPAILI